MRNISVLVLAIIITLTTKAAFADRVICRDGTKYEGIIIAENNDAVVMEVPYYPIRLSIYRGAIKQVQRGSESENAELRKKIADVKKERGFIE